MSRFGLQVCPKVKPIESMKYVFLSFLISLNIQILAQEKDVHQKLPSTPIPIEVVFGQRSGFYQHVISKNILQDKYNFFNVSNFDSKWGDNQDTHFIISNFLSRNLGKGFGFGIGAEIQGPGSFITVGGQYTYGTKKLLIVLFPSVNVNGPTEYSQFALVEFKPELNQDLRVYIRGQFLLTTNLKVLFRSYQQLRLGLQKENMLFGFAMNLDQFHVTGIEKENYGVFIRMLLL